MNMVLALVVLTIAFATGTTASTGVVRVDQVAPDSPAQKAGIQVGDVVRAIDGREIKRSTDLVSYVTSQARLHPDQEVTLEIERSGSPLPPIKAVPRAEPPEGEGPLGIRLEEVQGAVAVPVPEAFQQALSLSGQVVVQIAELPGQLLAPRTSTGGPTVGGPIEIFRITGQVAQSGIPTFLKLVGVLSVNLAVLNIVPFPGLDGGRLFFVLLRGIFRVRLSPQAEAAVHAVGFVLLLLLLVVVSIADIRRVVGG
jgi:regulator of sigma E protease